MNSSIKSISAYLFIAIFAISCSRPMAEFSMSSESYKAPATIKFNNESKKAETYTWEFGDGNNSEDLSPEHKFYLSGKYEVKLKARKGKKVSEKIHEVVINAPDRCLVEMKTSMGTMLIQLYDDTPLHRDNFLKLAESGYYKDLLFHRVINGFMVQGGDPKSRGVGPNQRLGSGGPGYQIDAEFKKDLFHIKGALAAARTGGPSNPKKRSSGSQFYIVQGKPVSEDQLKVMEAQKGIVYDDESREILMNQGGTPFLDQEYTVFGQVIEGLEIVDKIAGVPTSGADRPKEDVKILDVKVIK